MNQSQAQSNPSPTRPIPKSYAGLLLEESRAMAKYAAERGINIPASLAETVASFEKQYPDPDKIKVEEVGTLSDTHHRLSKILTPATPQAIVLLNKSVNEKNFMDYLGPTVLIRLMTAVGGVSLLVFLYVVQTEHINSEDINIFGSEGASLWVQLLFLLSASALGASFSALYKVNQYIKDMTYDPNQGASYWIRFFLGLISGLLLALVIEPNAIDSTFLSPNIVRPLLAILGGFSADLFYTFLNRMVETMKSLFEGTSKEILGNREQALNLKSDQREMALKMRISEKLLHLKNQISDNPDPEEIKGAFNTLWEELVPDPQPQGNGADNGN